MKEVVVKHLSYEKDKILHIRDIDGVTTEDELVGELKATLSSMEVQPDIKAVSIRPAFADNQNATVKLPATQAEKLLAKGHIRIGIVQCRVEGV